MFFVCICCSTYIIYLICKKSSAWNKTHIDSFHGIHKAKSFNNKKFSRIPKHNNRKDLDRQTKQDKK